MSKHTNANIRIVGGGRMLWARKPKENCCGIGRQRALHWHKPSSEAIWNILGADCYVNRRELKLRVE